MGDLLSRDDIGARPSDLNAPTPSLTNGDLGELLWSAAREETDHRRRALERASRASRFWPEEAGELAGSRRPLTELRAVGPWVAARIEAWLEAPPAIPELDETRRGFLTYAEVRRTLDADPAWESTPCADLQMHTHVERREPALSRT